MFGPGRLGKQVVCSSIAVVFMLGLFVLPRAASAVGHWLGFWPLYSLSAVPPPGEVIVKGHIGGKIGDVRIASVGKDGTFENSILGKVCMSDFLSENMESGELPKVHAKFQLEQGTVIPKQISVKLDFYVVKLCGFAGICKTFNEWMSTIDYDNKELKKTQKALADLAAKRLDTAGLKITKENGYDVVSYPISSAILQDMREGKRSLSPDKITMWKIGIFDGAGKFLGDALREAPLCWSRKAGK